ncbi:hypothetical protein Pla52o_11340 [Novipirellula galeiformis]|uniref:Uncharacterized protein n=1 Tax=Novipirellula galeiformis TaxID=2528004 RepID=A0A5C6CJ56_9BACT|nr:hypothetical protein Pla52o_11340 [Novipirellula galeiformis]
MRPGRVPGRSSNACLELKIQSKETVHSIEMRSAAPPAYAHVLGMCCVSKRNVSKHNVPKRFC